MYDPKALFVMNAISRESIAGELSTYTELDGNGTIKPNDPRLTDEFCQAYAGALGEALDYTESEEWNEEAEMNVNTEFAEKLLETSWGDAL